MTPADIPSLVAKTRAIADVVRNAGGAALYRKDLPDLDAIADALDALSPKEAELVKPPREYEVSGDAVGGGEAANCADYQQRRGRLPDLIEEAIGIFDEWMKDDDYDARRCLDNVIAKLKTARDWYDTPRSPSPADGGIPAGMDANAIEHLVFVMLDKLHEHLPEIDRPLAPYQLSDDQMQRATNAVMAVLGGIIAYTPKVPAASHDAARERIARAIALFETPDAPQSATDPWDWLYWMPKSRARFYALADAILAALPTTDGAEAMREACARYHDELATRHHKHADNNEPLEHEGKQVRYSPEAASAHRRSAHQHEAHAMAIRALPLATPPTTDATHPFPPAPAELEQMGKRLAGETIAAIEATTDASERMREAEQ